MNESGPVFLVGVKGSGKSHIGRLVARSTGRSFIDTDSEVERDYALEAGRTLAVRDIYRIDEGHTFRRLEAMVCRSIAARSGPVIVATGGGVCDNQGAAAELSAGIVVALQADSALLFRRILRKGLPPFLANRSEAQTEFEQLHRRRWAIYEAMAQIVVDVNDRPPAEIAAEIVIRLEEFLHGGK